MSSPSVRLGIMARVAIAAIGAAGMSLSAVASPPATQTSTPGLPGSARVDHVLLWAPDMDRGTAVMTVKLGFQVRPGRDPAGIANRYVRMADRSFIELETLTRPHPDLDPGSKADQDLLHGGAGVRTFGLGSDQLDAARDFLKGEGFAPTAVFAAPANDPDGPGVATDALAGGGPQVLGVSVAVDNLPRAKRWVERGYETTLKGYRGPLGDSFLAPTHGDLGLWVEFHAATHPH